MKDNLKIKSYIFKDHIGEMHKDLELEKMQSMSQL